MSVVVWIACACVISLSLAILFKRPAKAPPVVSEGLPVIGNLIGFASGPLDFIQRNYEAHGELFSVRVFHQTLTFMIGPKTSAPFFQNLDDTFSQNEVYGFMKAVFGANVVYDAPPAKRRAQMQHMAKGLKADRLKSYVPKIEKETAQYLRGWTTGNCDLLNDLSELTILTASRCLHGDDVRESMFNEVSQLYHDLDKGITPISFFWPSAPLASHRKRDEARAQMVKLFKPIIEQRRGKDGDDILQVFVDMKYKDGSSLSNDEITGLLIALLFAGQHTSSITSTWTLLFIANNPVLKKRLEEEQRTIFTTDRSATFDDLNAMELLHNCIKEALRMHPPLIMLMRKAMKDVAVGNYIIPKGDIVITSPAVAGRLDNVFKDPHTFDPDRYAPPREEHKLPFAHLGFGGGIHQCMGQQFGYTQVKTILSYILRNFDVSLPENTPFPEPDYTAMVVGPKGHPQLIYRKRKLC